MKRIVLVFVCLLSICSAHAQRAGKLSFIPRVGLNLSNLSDMDRYTLIDEGKMPPKSRVNIVAGAEVEYYVHNAVSISLGGYYSRQGCIYDDHSEKVPVKDTPGQFKYESFNNHSVDMEYVNIPLLAKYHINDIVSLKAGLQCGIFLSGHEIYDYTVSGANNTQAQGSSTEHFNDNIEWYCSKTVWSVPVGIEIEYFRTNISLSYAIPLTSFAKKVPGIGGAFYMSKGSNKVLSLTVGYRI